MKWIQGLGIIMIAISFMGLVGAIHGDADTTKQRQTFCEDSGGKYIDYDGGVTRCAIGNKVQEYYVKIDYSDQVLGENTPYLTISVLLFVGGLVLFIIGGLEYDQKEISTKI